MNLRRVTAGRAQAGLGAVAGQGGVKRKGRSAKLGEVSERP